ncbi:hypothetical protein K504DRAFT_455511 [Pleomassaria siparia CBS 279.74]|uniref:Uncharacterized protein n=1 Tax=Pleomassaria siparia CBS 279.74 TaxID=1314801 RepID=A0A6G1KBN7_9PLEO|nr:hypothetical protein K504DRAFT_455511 [Pleomassaria siparia CBS 279.74]
MSLRTPLGNTGLAGWLPGWDLVPPISVVFQPGLVCMYTFLPVLLVQSFSLIVVICGTQLIMKKYREGDTFVVVESEKASIRPTDRPLPDVGMQMQMQMQMQTNNY